MKYEQLSEHFGRSEFACKGDNCCGHSAPICQRLIDALEEFRRVEGKPININSGFRCYRHNLDIGSYDGSQHPRGTAADLALDGRDLKEFHFQAKRYFSVVIPYVWGLHVDVR